MAKKEAAPAQVKICDKCGHHNRTSADRCKECGSTRFAPKWVKELRHVTRNAVVQVTQPAERDGKQAPDRITLYKWWPGSSATFNIPSATQWERIKTIVDLELGPILGWTTANVVQAQLDAAAKDTRAQRKQVQSLAQSDPAALPKLLKSINLKKVDPSDYARIGDALGEIAAIYLNADEGLQHAIRTLVQSLPEQGEGAIRQLAELMETLTLAQITAVTSEVQRRVALLKTFKQRVTDDRTYEIRGAGSIHRLLEQAMWIVDERYWLMHSNETLRTQVGAEIEKRHKAEKLKRPDFVCGTVDGRLVIIEIKRPGHKLTVKDLNQLEEYIVIMDQYQQYSGFEATLVGKAVPAELQKILKLRSNRFRALSYAQLTGDAERRYAEYLTALGES